MINEQIFIYIPGLTYDSKGPLHIDAIKLLAYSGPKHENIDSIDDVSNELDVYHLITLSNDKILKKLSIKGNIVLRLNNPGGESEVKKDSDTIPNYTEDTFRAKRIGFYDYCSLNDENTSGIIHHILTYKSNWDEIDQNEYCLNLNSIEHDGLFTININSFDTTLYLYFTFYSRIGNLNSGSTNSSDNEIGQIYEYSKYRSTPLTELDLFNNGFTIVGEWNTTYNPSTSGETNTSNFNFQTSTECLSQYWDITDDLNRIYEIPVTGDILAVNKDEFNNLYYYKYNNATLKHILFHKRSPEIDSVFYNKYNLKSGDINLFNLSDLQKLTYIDENTYKFKKIKEWSSHGTVKSTMYPTNWSSGYWGKADQTQTPSLLRNSEFKLKTIPGFSYQLVRVKLDNLSRISNNYPSININNDVANDVPSMLIGFSQPTFNIMFNNVKAANIDRAILDDERDSENPGYKSLNGEIVGCDYWCRSASDMARMHDRCFHWWSNRSTLYGLFDNIDPKGYKSIPYSFANNSYIKFGINQSYENISDQLYNEEQFCHSDILKIYKHSKYKNLMFDDAYLNISDDQRLNTTFKNCVVDLDKLKLLDTHICPFRCKTTQYTYLQVLNNDNEIKLEGDITFTDNSLIYSRGSHFIELENSNQLDISFDLNFTTWQHFIATVRSCEIHHDRNGEGWELWLNNFAHWRSKSYWNRAICGDSPFDVINFLIENPTTSGAKYFLHPFLVITPSYYIDLNISNISRDNKGNLGIYPYIYLQDGIYKKSTSDCNVISDNLLSILKVPESCPELLKIIQFKKSTIPDPNDLETEIDYEEGFDNGYYSEGCISTFCNEKRFITLKDESVDIILGDQDECKGITLELDKGAYVLKVEELLKNYNFELTYSIDMGNENKISIKSINDTGGSTYDNKVVLVVKDKCKITFKKITANLKSNQNDKQGVISNIGLHTIDLETDSPVTKLLSKAIQTLQQNSNDPAIFTQSEIIIEKVIFQSCLVVTQDFTIYENINATNIVDYDLDDEKNLKQINADYISGLKRQYLFTYGPKESKYLIIGTYDDALETLNTNENVNSGSIITIYDPYNKAENEIKKGVNNIIIKQHV